MRFLPRGAAVLAPWWLVLASGLGCAEARTRTGPAVLEVQVVGDGAVTLPDGNECTSSCSVVVPAAVSVDLQPSSASGHPFVGWGGDCAGMGPAETCVLEMTTDRQVRALFAGCGGSPWAAELVTAQTSNTVLSGLAVGSDCAVFHWASVQGSSWTRGGRSRNSEMYVTSVSKLTAGSVEWEATIHGEGVWVDVFSMTLVSGDPILAVSPQMPGSGTASLMLDDEAIARVDEHTGFIILRLSGADGRLVQSLALNDVTDLELISERSGGLVAVGRMTGELTIGSDRLSVPSGGTDLFVARFDDALRPVWATQLHAEATNGLLSTATAPDGSVLISAPYLSEMEVAGTRLVPMGSVDSFIVSVDADGSPRWALGIPLAEDVTDEWPFAYYFPRVAVDANGTVWLHGWYRGEANLWDSPVSLGDGGVLEIALTADGGVSHVQAVAYGRGDLFPTTDASGRLRLQGTMQGELMRGSEVIRSDDAAAVWMDRGESDWGPMHVLRPSSGGALYLGVGPRLETRVVQGASGHALYGSFSGTLSLDGQSLDALSPAAGPDALTSFVVVDGLDTPRE